MRGTAQGLIEPQGATDHALAALKAGLRAT